MPMKIDIINGPNLNLTGTREPCVYGTRGIPQLLAGLQDKYPDMEFSYYQSNCEGELVTRIQESGFNTEGIILNAGAYTHTSIALRDAITAVEAPVVEVHISNVFAREEFRAKSMIAGVCIGSIAGFGLDSYVLAVEALRLRYAGKLPYGV